MPERFRFLLICILASWLIPAALLSELFSKDSGIEIPCVSVACVDECESRCENAANHSHGLIPVVDRQANLMGGLTDSQLLEQTSQ